jgi:hypothetical protein
MKIYGIIKAKKGNTNTPIYIKDKSDYSLFKEEYHRHMVMKKMELGEEVFNQQFRLCQFHDKLVQLDEYLRNYTDNHNS